MLATTKQEAHGFSRGRSHRQYRELESRFVEHCRALGRSVADVDLEIWKQYARDVRQAT